MEKNVGIDIDGVVLDILDPTIKYLKNVFHLDYKREDFKTYTIEDWIPYFTKDMAKYMFNDVELYRFSYPIEGAKWGIDRLRQGGWRVDLVTSRPDNLVEITLETLKKFKVTYDNLVFMKSDIKHKYANDECLVAFVEDRPQTAELLVEANIPLVVVLEAHYNKKELSKIKGITCAKDWRDIVHFVEDMDIPERKCYAVPLETEGN